MSYILSDLYILIVNMCLNNVHGCIQVTRGVVQGKKEGKEEEEEGLREETEEEEQAVQRAPVLSVALL